MYREERVHQVCAVYMNVCMCVWVRVCLCARTHTEYSITYVHLIYISDAYYMQQDIRKSCMRVEYSLRDKYCMYINEDSTYSTRQDVCESFTRARAKYVYYAEYWIMFTYLIYDTSIGAYIPYTTMYKSRIYALIVCVYT